MVQSVVLMAHCSKLVISYPVYENLRRKGPLIAFRVHLLCILLPCLGVIAGPFYIQYCKRRSKVRVL